MDVAEKLQSIWARPVTYEEPLWRHSSDGSTEGDPLLRGIGPRIRSAGIPSAAIKNSLRAEDGAHLRSIVNDFNANNSPLAFRVVESSWGLHIIPTRSKDANGAAAAATILMDEYVAVIPEKRSPFQHVEALTRALSSKAGSQVEAGTGILGFGFDNLFRQADTPPTLEWGTAGAVTAREALVSLLSNSATTLSWRLNCQPPSSTVPAYCVLNVDPIRLEARGTTGEGQILEWDRCVRCRPLGLPPAKP